MELRHSSSGLSCRCGSKAALCCRATSSRVFKPCTCCCTCCACTFVMCVSSAAAVPAKDVCLQTRANHTAHHCKLHLFVCTECICILHHMCFYWSLGSQCQPLGQTTQLQARLARTPCKAFAQGCLLKVGCCANKQRFKLQSVSVYIIPDLLVAACHYQILMLV